MKRGSENQVMKILLMNSYGPLGHKMIMSGRCQVKVNPGMGVWPPIDLAQIASMIKRYADNISILDFMVLHYSEKDIFRKLSNFNPTVVIVQSSTPTLNNDISFCRKIKAMLPNSTIIFFGLHATARPDDILCEEIRFAVRAEPEVTLAELIRTLKDDRLDFENIKGLSYRMNGKNFHNPDRGFVEDLDSFPFPERDLLQNKEYVLSYNKEPFTIITVSRGCPQQCAFCTSRLYYGGFCRYRSAESIISEIEEVLEKYRIKNFIFLSDTFNFDKEFVFRLCNLIVNKKLKIRWVCNSRVDMFDEKLAQAMKKAGCWLISLGVESGADTVLKNINKDITTIQSQKTIKIARESGMKTLCYFVFGLPGENTDTIRQTIDFIKKGKFDYAHFYTATPFPGTGFYEQAKKNRWLISEDWDRYFHGSSDVISYPHLSNKDIQMAITKAYRAFYLRPQIAWREISSVRSLRQFLGIMEISTDMLKLLFPKASEIHSGA